MNKKKTVSLVVLNYNGLEHLQEYFTSVFNQSLLPDEVFLFDNNSGDASVKFVKKKFPKVKIILEEKNYGTAHGSNIAFFHTKGDYVVFQSNDIVLDRNCVRELVQVLDRDEKIGICTSVLLNYKTGLIDNAGGDADIFGFPMQRYPLQSIKDIPDQEEVLFSYGGSFIVRRELFQEIGGFDGRYFTLNDDVDLCWRARMQGTKIVYNKKSIVYHKVSATLGKIYNRGIKHYWSERNAMRTFLKNEDLLHLLVNLPLYLLLFFAEMAYFLYRFKFNLFFWDLKALFWNMLYLPETMFYRLRIQLDKKQDASKLMKKTSFKMELFRNFSKAL